MPAQKKANYYLIMVIIVGIAGALVLWFNYRASAHTLCQKGSTFDGTFCRNGAGEITAPIQHGH